MECSVAGTWEKPLFPPAGNSDPKPKTGCGQSNCTTNTEASISCPHLISHWPCRNAAPSYHSVDTVAYCERKTSRRTRSAASLLDDKERPDQADPYPRRRRADRTTARLSPLPASPDSALVSEDERQSRIETLSTSPPASQQQRVQELQEQVHGQGKQQRDVCGR